MTKRKGTNNNKNNKKEEEQTRKGKHKTAQEKH